MSAFKLFSSMVRGRIRSWSEDYKYHFIHIPKNGGNSVRAALRKRGDVSMSRPYHYRHKDIADEVGRNLQFFCIIRNPWSRTASRYVFARQNAREWATDDPRKQYIEKAGFENFVRDQEVFDIPEHPGQPWMGPMNSWFNQLEWIRNEDNEVVCDCLRLENLQEDISTYFGNFIALPRANVTKERYDYRQMYTDELIDLVARTFEEDVSHFGFTFESGATKNIAHLL
jgi:hypothetical protein